jgi:hypothetical protein
VCPQHWHLYDGSCWHMSNGEVTSWQAARDTCKETSSKADLVCYCFDNACLPFLISDILEIFQHAKSQWHWGIVTLSRTLKENRSQQIWTQTLLNGTEDFLWKSLTLPVSRCVTFVFSKVLTGENIKFLWQCLRQPTSHLQFTEFLFLLLIEWAIGNPSFYQALVF